jgi:hypothetical protein
VDDDAFGDGYGSADDGYSTATEGSYAATSGDEDGQSISGDSASDGGVCSDSLSEGYGTPMEVQCDTILGKKKRARPKKAKGRPKGRGRKRKREDKPANKPVAEEVRSEKRYRCFFKASCKLHPF